MKNFIEMCKRTECEYEHAVENINPRVAHALFGLETEVGELIDPFKKFWFYGGVKPLDMVNIREEIGDILWYLSILMDEIDTDFETEMDRVVRKLETRYPEKFTSELAHTRDLKKEWDVLNGQTHSNI
jgi:NTP pyrophosphatase (non-canonical NTP hydrolase)